MAKALLRILDDTRTASIIETLKKEKDKSATRKVGNEGKSGNKDKKAAVKKKEAPKADLFGQAEDEPETNNTTDEEQSEDLDNTAE